MGTKLSTEAKQSDAEYVGDDREGRATLTTEDGRKYDGTILIEK